MRASLYPRFILLLLIIGSEGAGAEPLPRAVLDGLDRNGSAVVQGVRLLSARLLGDLYAGRGDALAWDDRSRVQALLALLESSAADGFSRDDFHQDLVRSMAAPDALDGLSDTDRAEIDILLSDALLRYVHHSRYGKLDPVAVDRKWNDRAPVPAERILAEVSGALASEDMAAYLDGRFEPPFWYRNLKRALGAYRQMERFGGLSPLPSGGNLALGARGPRVAMLRERLALMGLGAAGVPESLELFDAALREAVVGFQRRFGLVTDGVVGPKTLAALNQPFDPRRVEQIRINLERMRWLYADLPSDYVFVDVADYMVHLVRGGEIVWSTRVIVGSQEDQTPMFRDTMEHLVFNPTWTVPISIQKEMGKASSRYTLFDRRTGRKVSGGDARDFRRYQLVQPPGPRNALGRVKFMFPNRHSVYLHDTPSKSLFRRRERALSHGCVRVQNPFKLAELVLDKPYWDESQIDRVIGASRTRYINLDRGLPVLLYYLTAQADAEGGFSFRRDVYGRDPGLLEAFAQPVDAARIAFPEPPEEPDVSPAQGTPGPGAPASKKDEGKKSPAAPASQNGVRLTQSEQGASR